MAREGFHPDYHDHRFEDDLPPDEDDPEPPRSRPRLLDGVRLRALAAGGRKRLLAVLSTALVVAVGYAMLPTASEYPDPFRPAPTGGLSQGPGAARPPAPVPAGPTGGPATAMPPDALIPPVVAPSPDVLLAPRIAPSGILPAQDPRDPFTGEQPSPVGGVIKDLTRDDAPDRVINMLGRQVRLPTRNVTVTSDAWKEPRTLSLPFVSVAADGKVVEAMPSAGLLVRLAVGLAVAMLVGCAVGHGVTYVVEKGFPPYEGYESGWGRVTVGAAMLLAVYMAVGHVPPPAIAVLGLSALATFGASRWRRLQAFVLALSAVAAGFALATPVIPPYAGLADEYGVLGIYAWDVVACAAAAVAGALWLLLPRFGGTVHVHTPGHPLIQNVRVVEDRRAP